MNDATLLARLERMKDSLYEEARKGNVMAPFGTSIPDILGEAIRLITHQSEELKNLRALAK